MNEKSPLECQDCGFEHNEELSLLRDKVRLLEAMETAIRQGTTYARPGCICAICKSLAALDAWRAEHAAPVSDQEAAER